jgi:membrane protease YdiL (CAAX protease family)
MPGWISGLAVCLSGVWLIIGSGVYLRLARLVARGEGKVGMQEFGQPDALLCLGFLIFFGVTITVGFGAPDHEVTQKEIIHGGIFYLEILVLIAAFLHFRGINPLRQFGLFPGDPFLCIAFAIGLLVAACPLLFTAQWLTDLAMHGNMRAQNIVEFFRNASESSDKRAVYLTMLVGVIVAPLAEETIFRGYIYGVLKRYTGCVVAALINSGVFAAAHLNLSSLPELFVLGLCFTLAYEATGSLLVNILMHSLFNLTMLLILLYISPPGAS